MGTDETQGSAGPVPAEPLGPGTADPGTAAGPVPSRLVRGWRAWRRWRRARPFWGGLLIILAGIEIFLTVLVPLPVVMHIGLQGVAGFFVPIIMVVCGLLLWFNPDQRLFYSVIAVIMALGSWITSNLGGFFIGLLLGLIGGSLAFAWAPVSRHRRADGA